MKTSSQGVLFLTLLAAISSLPSFGAAQVTPQRVDSGKLAARVFERERATIQYLGTLRPVVQIYVQSTKENGEPAGGDIYFLGEWNVATALKSDLTHRVVPHVSLIAGQHDRSIGSKIGNRYTFHPDDLTQMFFVDVAYFSSSYYSLTFDKEEDLAGIHCAVFKVAPIPADDLGRVEGSIWVDPESASIIRIHGHFTGEVRRQDGNPEFDSWRWKSPSGYWVPNYLYSESTAANPSDNLPLLRMRMSIEVWGYGRENVAGRPSRTALPYLSPRANDAPVEAKVVRWLDDNGLVAQPGAADETVCAVARRIMAVSALPERRIDCRVLMTSPLESFAAGQTLVVSRGLLDLLPDEAALAAVISDEVAHILLGLSDPPLIDAEGNIFARGKVPAAMKFHSNTAHERAARELAAQLIRKSPYAGTPNRLSEFASAVEHSDPRRKIFRAPFGGQIAEQIVLLSKQLGSDDTVHPGALALGSRVEVNPWSDSIWFARTYRGIPSRTFPFGVAARIPSIQPENLQTEDAGATSGQRSAQN